MDRRGVTGHAPTLVQVPEAGLVAVAVLAVDHYRMILVRPVTDGGLVPALLSHACVLHLYHCGHHGFSSPRRVRCLCLRP